MRKEAILALKIILRTIIKALNKMQKQMFIRSMRVAVLNSRRTNIMSNEWRETTQSELIISVYFIGCLLFSATF